MHPDDFNGNHDRSNANSTPNLPSSIDTLDDAIAYLQRARATMGGNTKFRLVADGREHDEDYYARVEDVILTGNKSLMPKSHRKEGNDYVLFCYC
jgi:hypothetical protein